MVFSAIKANLDAFKETLEEVGNSTKFSLAQNYFRLYDSQTYYNFELLGLRLEIKNLKPNEQISIKQEMDRLRSQVLFQYKQLIQSNKPSETPLEKLQEFITESQCVIVEGESYSGKTHFVQEFLQKAQKDHIFLSVDSSFEISQLIGNYIINNDGVQTKLLWKEGPLLKALKKGLLLVLDNFDLSSPELKGFVMNLIVQRQCQYKNFSQQFHFDFNLLILTQEMNFFSSNNFRVSLPLLSLDQIVSQQIEQANPFFALVFQLSTILIREFKCMKFLEKLLIRLRDFEQTILQGGYKNFLSSDSKLLIYLNIIDIYFSGDYNLLFLSPIYEEINSLFQNQLSWVKYIESYSLNSVKNVFTSRRFNMEVNCSHSENFVFTQKNILILEQILGSIKFQENLLLVGETGTGKTTLVQQIAKNFNKTIKVINLSHSTDSSELFGGFKPVNNELFFQEMLDSLKSILIRKIKDDQNSEFFQTTRQLIQNKKFELLAKYLLQSCQMVTHSLELDSVEQKRITRILRKTKNFLDNPEMLEKNQKFQFIKGIVWQAVEQNEWILFDEINLASEEVLLKLYQILSQKEITLLESNELEKITKPDGFRIFACMNPGYEVGKKPLPERIKKCFTIINKDPIDSFDEIFQITQSIMKNYPSITADIQQKIATFYHFLKLSSTANSLLDKNNQKIVFSLRQLQRTFGILKNIMTQTLVSMSKTFSIYISFRISFFLDLSSSSQKAFNQKFEQIFNFPNVHKEYLKNDFQTPLAQVASNPRYYCYERHPLLKISPSVQIMESFIVTDTIHQIKLDLLKILMFDNQIPVLLEGPTSTGKTTLIQYLASIQGQHVVRINNHKDTDIDEYIGKFVPTKEGKIQFESGALVKCMENGNWLLLDELNLARTEILEALNRVLDDNQELFVSEIQKTIKPHPNFRIFATQNPSFYSGRGLLSKAFKNRFICINYDKMNSDDLKKILVSKCQIADSRVDFMIQIKEKLSFIRNRESLLENKSGIITVRDLIKWGNKKDFMITKEEMAYEGFSLLAERVRNEEDKSFMRDIIRNEFKIRKFCENDFYEQSLNKLKTQLNLSQHEHIEWSQEFSKLFLLVWKAFLNKEPVLLVGETGCGKTTLAQLIASIMGIEFFYLNCHKNTEVADFLGNWRPSRDKNQTQKRIEELFCSNKVAVNSENFEEIQNVFETHNQKFSQEDQQEMRELLRKMKQEFQWVDGKLVQAIKNGGVFLVDEISLASDNVLERFNSLLEFERKIFLQESEEGSNCELKAHENFLLIATMNPSGDYGKKELSPALRNRFTEIWVTSALDFQNMKNKTQVKQFVSNIVKRKFQANELLTEFLFDLVIHFNEKWCDLFTPLNLRDLESLIMIFKSQLQLEEQLNLRYCSEYLFQQIMGSTENESLKQFQFQKIEEFKLAHSQTFGFKISFDIQLDFNQAILRLNHFSVPLVKQSLSNYVLNEPVVTKNLFNLLTGLGSAKPIMLEGPPGVGKTSLISTLADIVGKKVHKVSIFAQTEMLDLLGSDVPDPNHIGSFKWLDGVLLQAMKNGDWIVFDELNLANQTILEGLNGILDFRGEIFIPELNAIVRKAEGFQFFATQNPVSQGKGRKNLPRSFLNRFYKVFFEEMSNETVKLISLDILKNKNLLQYSQFFQLVFSLIEEKLLDKKFFNIRFMDRVRTFFQLYESHTSLLFLFKIAFYFFLVLQQTNASEHPMIEVFKKTFQNTDLEFQFSTNRQLLCITDRINYLPVPLTNFMDYKNSFMDLNLQHLWFVLGFCIDCKFPVIIQSEGQEEQISSILEQMSRNNNQLLKQLFLYKQADESDLLGSYEQMTFSDLLGYLEEKLRALNRNHEAEKIHSVKGNEEELLKVLRSVKKDDEIKGLIDQTIESIQSQRPHFQWVDSQLVKAVINGHWIVISGCENANPALLEKLNSLLEDDYWTINECFDKNGEVRKIEKHPNFKIFLTFQKKRGFCEISAPLQNRSFLVDVERCAQLKNHILKEDTFFCNARNLLRAQEKQILQKKELLEILNSYVKENIPSRKLVEIYLRFLRFDNQIIKYEKLTLLSYLQQTDLFRSQEVLFELLKEKVENGEVLSLDSFGVDSSATQTFVQDRGLQPFTNKAIGLNTQFIGYFMNHLILHFPLNRVDSECAIVQKFFSHAIKPCFDRLQFINPSLYHKILSLLSNFYLTSKKESHTTSQTSMIEIVETHEKQQNQMVSFLDNLILKVKNSLKDSRIVIETMFQKFTWQDEQILNVDLEFPQKLVSVLMNRQFQENFDEDDLILLEEQFQEFFKFVAMLKSFQLSSKMMVFLEFNQLINTRSHLLAQMHLIDVVQQDISKMQQNSLSITFPDKILIQTFCESFKHRFKRTDLQMEKTQTLMEFFESDSSQTIQDIAALTDSLRVFEIKAIKEKMHEMQEGILIHESQSSIKDSQSHMETVLNKLTEKNQTLPVNKLHLTKKKTNQVFLHQKIQEHFRPQIQSSKPVNIGIRQKAQKLLQQIENQGIASHELSLREIYVQSMLTGEFLFQDPVYLQLQNTVNQMEFQGTRDLLYSFNFSNGKELAQMAIEDVIMFYLFYPSKTQLKSNFHQIVKSTMIKHMDDIANFFNEMNIQLNDKNKKKLTVEAEQMKLEQNLAKIAKYEYSKVTVLENKQKQIEEIKEFFKDYKEDFLGSVEDKPTNVEKTEEKYFNSSKNFFFNLIVEMLVNGNKKFLFKAPLEMVSQILMKYKVLNKSNIDLYQKVLSFQVKKVLSQEESPLVLKNLSRVRSGDQFTSPLKSLVFKELDGIIEKSKVFSFYEENENPEIVERIISFVIRLNNKLLVLSQQIDFKENTTLFLLLNYCHKMIYVHIKTPLSKIASGLQLILSNIQLLNEGLRRAQKLQEEEEIALKNLTEMRKLEKKKWKDILVIEQMKYKFRQISYYIEFANQIHQSGVQIEYLAAIDRFLQESTLGNLKINIFLVFNLISSVSNPDFRKCLKNLVGFYSSYDEFYEETMKDLLGQVDQPMKEIQKLMNWHFSDFLNLKMNMEKLYRGISRCKKKQEEIMDIKFADLIITPQRTKQHFISIENFVQNITPIANEAPKPVKKVFSSAMVEKLSEKHFALKKLHISYFRMISFKDLLELLQEKEKQLFSYCFEKDSKMNYFEEMVHSYLERVSMIQDQKLNFKVRMLVDMFQDLESLFDYRRISIDHLFSYRLVFENISMFEADDLQLELPLEIDCSFKEKLKKINLRTFRMIDFMKQLKQDRQFHHNIEASQQERIIGLFFGVYFKYLEFNMIVERTIKTGNSIINLDSSRKEQLKESILFYTDLYLDVDNLTKELLPEELEALKKLKSGLVRKEDIQGTLQIQAIRFETLNELINQWNQKASQSVVDEKFDDFYKTRVIQFKKAMRNYEKTQGGFVLKEKQILLHSLNHLKSVNEFLLRKGDGYNLKADSEEVLKMDVKAKILQAVNFLYSFNKFMYILGITMQNLLYKGFCISKEEEQKQTEGEEEMDFGTGMGDGQGNDNVADQIEFEEQVLGEMKQDVPEDQDDKPDPNGEEEDQMEMENDFDGKNDENNEKEKEENEEKKKEEMKDEFDDVAEEDLDPQMHRESDDEEAEEEQENQKKSKMDLKRNEIDEENEELKAQEEKEEERNLKENEEPVENNKNPEQDELEELEKSVDEEYFDEDYQKSFENSMKEDDAHQSQNEDFEDLENNDNEMEIEMDDQKEEIEIEENEEENQNQEMEIEEEEENQQENDEDQPMEEQKQPQEGFQEGVQQQEDEKEEAQGFGNKEDKKDDAKEQQKERLMKELIQKEKFDYQDMEDLLENIDLQPHEEQEEEPQEQEEQDYQQAHTSTQKRRTQQSQQENKKEENNKDKPDDFKMQEIHYPLTNAELQDKSQRELMEEQFKNYDFQASAQKKEQPLMKDLAEILENFSGNKAIERIIEGSDFGLVLQESRMLINKEANKLCEQIKTVLEQKDMNSLKGDYRTGKKLNMKKIVAYIASHYRKDKIWLRKSIPDEKNYQIMIAVDNSLSMKEKSVGKLALFSLAILSKAITKAQVGELFIAKIENGMKLLNQSQIRSDFESEALLSQFDFMFQEEKSMDLSISSFIRDSWRKMFKVSDKKKICFIISDGRTNCNIVRKTMLDEQIRDVIYFFIILDSQEWDKSILNYQITETRMEEGELKVDIRPFLSDFPFEHYVVLKDVNQLCQTIVKVLLEYFEKYEQVF